MHYLKELRLLDINLNQDIGVTLEEISIKLSYNLEELRAVNYDLKG